MLSNFCNTTLILFPFVLFLSAVTVVEESEIFGPLDARMRKFPAELDTGFVAHQATRFDSSVRPGRLLGVPPLSDGLFDLPGPVLEGTEIQKTMDGLYEI